MTALLIFHYKYNRGKYISKTSLLRDNNQRQLLLFLHRAIEIYRNDFLLRLLDTKCDKPYNNKKKYDDISVIYWYFFSKITYNNNWR